MRRLTARFAGALVVVALVANVEPGLAQTKPGRLGQPRSISDEKLLTQFFDLIIDQDLQGLATYLSPAFVLQRSDGTVVRKQEYLANPSSATRIELNEVGGTRTGGARVIYAVVTSDTVIDGQPVQSVNSPRLASYAWNGKRWQMTSYANFAPLG